MTWFPAVESRNKLRGSGVQPDLESWITVVSPSVRKCATCLIFTVYLDCNIFIIEIQQTRMAQTMKALRFHGQKDLRFEDIPVPEVKDGQVKVTYIMPFNKLRINEIRLNQHGSVFVELVTGN
jgi:hypothetical protein